MANPWQSVIGVAFAFLMCWVALRVTSKQKEQRLRPPHDSKKLPIYIWMPPSSAFLHIFICRAVDFWNTGLEKPVFKLTRSGDYDVAILCEDEFKPNKVLFQTNYNRPIAIIEDVMHSENRDREISRALGRCLGYSLANDPMSVMYAKALPGKFRLSKQDKKTFDSWATHLA